MKILSTAFLQRYWYISSSEVMGKKGIEPLIEMLSDSCELASANAASVLTNMSTDESLRSEIQRLGIVPALIEPLKSR